MCSAFNFRKIALNVSICSVKRKKVRKRGKERGRERERKTERGRKGGREGGRRKEEGIPRSKMVGKPKSILQGSLPRSFSQ